MKFAKINASVYLLRLEKGEEVISVIQNFAQDHEIKNAKIEGLGSIESPTLAHYRVDSKKYSEKIIEGIFEVTSLVGNIAFFEDKPLIHSHVTIGDEEMRSFGGHLVKGNVSATLELVVTCFPSAYKKSFNDEIGLKLWDLDDTV